MTTEQERHVFCAWCWRAVPAHGDTYIPMPHPDTLGNPCRGEAMCGATTYSVGTPPCERDKGRAFAYAVPSARDIEAVLAERSAEAEALRAEVARLRKELDAARAARDVFIGATANLAVASVLDDDEVTRLRATARALYRHAAGESVGVDALDEAMRHGREIHEAEAAGEVSS